LIADVPIPVKLVLIFVGWLVVMRLNQKENIQTEMSSSHQILPTLLNDCNILIKK